MSEFKNIACGHVSLLDFATDEDVKADPQVLDETFDSLKAALRAYEDFAEALEIFGACMQALSESVEDEGPPMDDPAFEDIGEWVEILRNLQDAIEVSKDLERSKR